MINLTQLRFANSPSSRSLCERPPPGSLREEEAAELKLLFVKSARHGNAFDNKSSPFTSLPCRLTFIALKLAYDSVEMLTVVLRFDQEKVEWKAGNRRKGH